MTHAGKVKIQRAKSVDSEDYLNKGKESPESQAASPGRGQ